MVNGFDHPANNNATGTSESSTISTTAANNNSNATSFSSGQPTLATTTTTSTISSAASNTATSTNSSVTGVPGNLPTEEETAVQAVRNHVESLKHTGNFITVTFLSISYLFYLLKLWKIFFHVSSFKFFFTTILLYGFLDLFRALALALYNLVFLSNYFVSFIGNNSATSWRSSTTAPLGLDSLAGSGPLSSTTTGSADTNVVSATETASATTSAMEASSTMGGDAGTALSGLVTSSAPGNNALPYPASSLNSEDTLASQLSGTTTSSSSAATDFANLKSSSLFGSVMNHTASTAIGSGGQKSAAGSNGSGTAETQEVRLQPVHGVAPLGPVHLSQERVKQLKMLDGAYHHLPQRQDSERMRLVGFIICVFTFSLILSLLFSHLLERWLTVLLGEISVSQFFFSTSIQRLFLPLFFPLLFILTFFCPHFCSQTIHFKECSTNCPIPPSSSPTKYRFTGILSAALNGNPFLYFLLPRGGLIFLFHKPYRYYIHSSRSILVV